MAECLDCALDACDNCALETYSLIGEEACCCGRITAPREEDADA